MELLTGYTKKEFIRMSWKKLVANKNDLEQMLKYHKQRRIDSGTVPNNYEFELLTKNGERVDVMATVNIIPETDKSVLSLLDISERKRKEEKISYLAYHDQLTGLYNKTYLNKLVEGWEIERKLPISIIMGSVT
jgi:PAS domain S-box-containing protein